MLLFSVRAEQICYKPLGPILFLAKISFSIDFVYYISVVISIAPRFPSLLSVRSSSFKSE